MTITVRPVVVLCPHFDPDTAPTGVVMTRIVGELVELGHTVHVVTSLPGYRAHRIEPGWTGRLVRTETTSWGSITRVHPFPGRDKSNLWRRAVGFGAYSVLAGLQCLRVGGWFRRSGAVIAMSPETLRHNKLKFAIAKALETAVSNAGLTCEVFPDGAGVVIDEMTVREPDVSVQCGNYDPDSLVLDNPVVVVEVLSPSSIQRDSIAKVDEYFRVPSIAHYLVVDPYNRLVIHHTRMGSAVERKVHDSGTLSLSPPGISVPVEALVGKFD